MTQHKYEEIAEYYREKIRDGELAEGTRLPPVRELAAFHGVAPNTIKSAMSWLAEEGFIRTSPRGTFVNDEPPVGSSPADRLQRLHRNGSILAKGETKIVTAAELIVPPVYVGDLFGLDDGDQVVRREFTIGKDSRRLALVVTWHPAQFAVHVPDLLSTAPGKCDDAVKLIQVTTGRTVKYWRDSMHARKADRREANFLGIPVGDPTLAMAWEWGDGDGIIEYGECCLPPMLTIGYGAGTQR